MHDVRGRPARRCAEILSDMITGDVASYGDIDDVRIQLYTGSNDGAGGTLGTGGWMELRSDSMVAEGGLLIDSADIDSVESRGLLDELLMHEMLHAIGWGTTWSYQGLESGNMFVGENATDVYGSAVPLDGNGHLSESVGDEMGTTYISGSTEPITDLTFAVLEDMGFDTTYDPDAALAAAMAEEEEPMLDEWLIA